MEDKLSVVITSFDGYSDLWDTFFDIFNRYWSECKYPKYLINNQLKSNWTDVLAINTGEERNWKYRMIKGLESINSKYVLVLLEDYLLGQTVNNKDIDQIIWFMEKNNIVMYKIDNQPKLNGKINSYSFIAPIYKDTRYGVNFQTAVWNREELIGIIKKLSGNQCWDFEYFFLKKTKGKSHVPLKGFVSDKRNLMNIQNGVLRGKWFRSTLRFYKKRGYVIDTKKRDVMTIKETIIYRLRCLCRKCFSDKMVYRVKKIANKIGIKFASEY